MLLVLIIVLVIIIGIMIIAFLFIVVALLKQNTTTNDQLIFSNFEWADKFKNTVDYYEKEISGLMEEMYGNEEELKN